METLQPHHETSVQSSSKSCVQTQATLLDQGTESLPFRSQVSICLHFTGLLLVKHTELGNKFGTAVFPPVAAFSNHYQVDQVPGDESQAIYFCIYSPTWICFTE